MNLNLYKVDGSQPLSEALKKIEANQSGFIIVVDAADRVSGLATDGDIRRYIINGGLVENRVLDCTNRDFKFVRVGSSRENILKNLNGHVRFLLILDVDGKLADIVGQNGFPIQEESAIYVRARSPVRISFGGGGSDLNHFLVEEQGAVINATLAMYSHAILRLRVDKKVIVKSSDLGSCVEAENLKQFLSMDDDLGLIRALLRAIHPEFGFELDLKSDYPTRSGLGGSAVVSSAVLGCFNMLRRDKWDRYELAEIAYQAERIFLGVEGGWQDQYATVFGGINFMEFRMDQNVVHPLRVPTEILLELEENLLLCQVGGAHHSSEIHQDQRQQMRKEKVKDLVRQNVALTYRIRDQLLRGKLFEFAESLDLSWKNKREFSDKISNPEIDKIYAGARAHGALGGKLLGAGGGGFLLIYCDPFRRSELDDYLNSIGSKVFPVRFEHQGLKAWTSRETHSAKTGL